MAKGRGGTGRGRIEPTFDASGGRARDRGDLDLHLSREDRAGAGGRVARKSGPAAGARRSGTAKRARRGRSWLGRLVYGGVVLGLWAMIGLAGLIAYHASQLPPIDEAPALGGPPDPKTRV